VEPWGRRALFLLRSSVDALASLLGEAFSPAGDLQGAPLGGPLTVGVSKACRTVLGRRSAAVSGVRTAR